MSQYVNKRNLFYLASTTKNSFRSATHSWTIITQLIFPKQNKRPTEQTYFFDIFLRHTPFPTNPFPQSLNNLSYEYQELSIRSYLYFQVHSDSWPEVQQRRSHKANKAGIWACAYTWPRAMQDSQVRYHVPDAH